MKWWLPLNPFAGSPSLLVSNPHLHFQVLTSWHSCFPSLVCLDFFHSDPAFPSLILLRVLSPLYLFAQSKFTFLFYPPKQGLPRSPKMQCWANDRWLHGSEGGRQQKGWENKWWDRVLGLSNNHTSWTEPGRRWIYRLGGGSRWKESRYLFRTGYLIQPKLIYSHMNKFEVTYRVKTTVSNLCQLFPGDIMTL